jgi:hypothetical protein
VRERLRERERFMAPTWCVRERETEREISVRQVLEQWGLFVRGLAQLTRTYAHIIKHDFSPPPSLFLSLSLSLSLSHTRARTHTHTHQVLEQRGLLLRGLAHPSLFDAGGFTGGGLAVPGLTGGDGGDGPGQNIYQTFGAVPVRRGRRGSRCIGGRM